MSGSAARAYERVRVAAGEGIATITLANPQRRNALGPQMISELLWALEDARADEAVRAIVLTGEGKAFCAGGDFTSAPDASALPSKGDFVDLLLALYRSDKPVVARVNGDAMGGGLGLVAASTLAVAASTARLGTPEIDLGLFPMMIMAVLARHVPRRRLTEMMLLGQRFDAAEAARLGLVNRAVAPEALDAEVAAITSALAGKSASTVRLGLRAFAAQDDLELERALPFLRDRLAEVLATEDAREGLMAFVEKRAPAWKGR
ncbi:MAG TPA: enoyl-CoA hydratase-related protein [Polyangiaceae bacterium]|nr:enoyl-CoA hydratase-related protein [Polyangiaceae bacterium]